MAIDKKLITFIKKDVFLGANGTGGATTPTNGYYGLIPSTSVVFILDTLEFWTHGKFFKGTDTKVTTVAASANTNYYIVGKANAADTNTGYTSTNVYFKDGVLYSNGTAVSVDGHTHDYLPLSGGTMTGGIIMYDNQYFVNSKYGINMANSDIVGANSIYTSDLADNTSEGIRFYRSETTWDTLTASNGVIYFMPNDVLTGTALTSAYKVYHTGYKPTYSDVGAAAASHTHTFASLTSKPTTISGYGITDAITTSNIGSQSVASAVSATAISANGIISDLNSPDWSTGNITYDRFSSSASNKPISVNNANGVINVSFTKHNSSGEYGYQLAGVDNGRLYYRKWTAGSADSWKSLAFSGESQPASDVYSWAKASTKPSYAASELTDYSSLITTSNIGIQSVANADTVDGVHASSLFQFRNWEGVNFDFTDGSGISGWGELHSSYAATNPPFTYGQLISFDTGDCHLQIAVDTDLNLVFRNKWWTGGRGTDYPSWQTIIHSGNIGSQSVSYATSSGNAATATTLQTSRSLWGQSFDGSANVSGAMTNVQGITMNGGYFIYNLHTVYPASTDTNHALYFGYSLHDYIDWHEYGGIWRFWSGNSTGQGDGTLEVQLGTTNYFKGNVGIGTTSPSYKLDVNGSANVSTLNLSNGTSGTSSLTFEDGEWYDRCANFHLPSGEHSWNIYDSSSNELFSVYTSGNVYFKGNVGIGTSSPTHKLDVNGAPSSSSYNVASIAEFRCYSSSIEWSVGLKNTYNYESTGYGVGLKLALGDDSETSKWCGLAAVAETTYANRSCLAIYTSTNERVRIDSDGNVGIGTTNPLYKFDVNGNFHCSYAMFGDSGLYINGYGLYTHNGVSWESNVATFNSSGVSHWSSSMYIDGSVGIGTTSPSTRLHVVKDGTLDDYGALYITGSGTCGSGTWYRPMASLYPSIISGSHLNYYLGKANSQYNGGYIAYYHSADSSVNNYVSLGLFAVDDQLVVNGYGYVGIGTTSPSYKLHVNGNVGASNYYSTSDRRLKSDIKVLEFRGELKPKEFIKDGKKQLGFIAQEVRELYPELVEGEETEDTYLTLSYGNITAVLAAQNKKQQEEIDSLKSEVAELRKMVEALMKK